VAQGAGGALVALALRVEALADDCERAALVVTARQPPTTCGASVVSAERLRRQGALALRRNGSGFAIDAVRPSGIDRPWSPALAGEADTETNILAPRLPGPRAVDATPPDADLQADE
jgi:competence protein ComEC